MKELQEKMLQKSMERINERLQKGEDFKEVYNSVFDKRKLISVSEMISILNNLDETEQINVIKRSYINCPYPDLIEVVYDENGDKVKYFSSYCSEDFDYDGVINEMRDGIKYHLRRKIEDKIVEIALEAIDFDL